MSAIPPRDSIQDGIKFSWSHRCSIQICHPFDSCNRGYAIAARHIAIGERDSLVAKWIPSLPIHTDFFQNSGKIKTFLGSQHLEFYHCKPYSPRQSENKTFSVFKKCVSVSMIMIRTSIMICVIRFSIMIRVILLNDFTNNILLLLLLWVGVSLCAEVCAFYVALRNIPLIKMPLWDNFSFHSNMSSNIQGNNWKVHIYLFPLVMKDTWLV